MGFVSIITAITITSAHDMTHDIDSVHGGNRVDEVIGRRTFSGSEI